MNIEKKLEKNLETVIGHLDSLMSQVSTTHPDYDNYMRAVNTAVMTVKVFQLIKFKKQKKYLLKKEKLRSLAMENQKNDSN